ncbi:hypothetical protein ACS0TY_006896 [Phlomoides rotata]
MCIDYVMAKLSTPMKTRTFFLLILLILLVPLFFNCSVNMLDFFGLLDLTG